MEITWLDVLVGIVIVASAAYAAWKGLLRETLSIFAWALAAYAALVFGRWLHNALGDSVSPPWLNYALSYGGIFLIVLVPLSFLSYRFSESVQKSPVGPVDRTLGFVFGIGRGLVLVALPYIAFTMLVPIKDQPGWVANAATLPLIQKTSDVLLSLVPGDKHASAEPDDENRPIQRHRHRHERAAEPEQQQAAGTTAKPAPVAAHKPAPKPARNAHNPPANGNQKTYGPRERRALDRLIETTGGDEAQSE